jgi:hypothetical protein
VMLWLTLPGRLSPLGAATTRTSCRTQYTASYPNGRRISSRSWGEERNPQDGDGALPGCDLGVEGPLTGCLAIDLVSLHPVTEH